MRGTEGPTTKIRRQGTEKEGGGRLTALGRIDLSREGFGLTDEYCRDTNEA